MYGMCVRLCPAYRLISSNSSGDTGVRAGLLLHGTPPFQVTYQAQKGRGTPRTHTMTFQSSRDEIIIRPPEEGDYTFSITHISDAYYKKEEVKAKSMKQTIHPVASAEFAGSGRRKQRLSICEDRTIDVDVHLRVRFIFRIVSR